MSPPFFCHFTTLHLLKPRLDRGIANVLEDVLDRLRQLLGQWARLDDFHVLFELLQPAAADDDGVTQAGVEGAVVRRPTQRRRVARDVVLGRRGLDLLDGCRELGLVVELRVRDSYSVLFLAVSHRNCQVQETRHLWPVRPCHATYRLVPSEGFLLQISCEKAARSRALIMNRVRPSAWRFARVYVH